MSIVAYLVGFPRREAVSIGASFSARGGESVMYASVGSKAASATKGAELYPIAGAITFVMSVLCPFFIKKSYDIADWVARRASSPLVYGGAVLSRTLNKVVMPGSKLFVLSRPLLAALVAYLGSVLLLISFRGVMLLPAYAAAIASCAAIWYLLGRDLRKVADNVDYHNLGTLPEKQAAIGRYVSGVVVLALLMAAHVALLFAVYWPSVLVLSLAYTMWTFHLMKQSYRRTCDPAAYEQIRARNSQAPVPLEIEKPAFNHRERWRNL